MSHDFAPARALIARLPQESEAAMMRATLFGIALIREQVINTVAARTRMDRARVDQIVNSEAGPSPGVVARGRVSFEDPPAYFYATHTQANGRPGMLRFTIGNRVFYRARVKGSRPYKLIPRAAETAERSVEKGFDREVGEVFG